MINKSEANLVSFKILLTRDNKIVTEFSMLPENMVDEVFPLDDRALMKTVIRNGKLYDKIGHTDVWDTTKIYEVDVVWYYDFVDLPQVFKDYITSRAATRCAIRLVGDVNLTQALASFETWRRANCLEYECNEGDYTMFGFKQGDGFYSSYKPFKALAR